jgi:integrase
MDAQKAGRFSQKIASGRPQPGKPEVVGDGSVQVLIYFDRDKTRTGYRVVFWRGRQRVRKFFIEYAQAKEEARRIAGNLRAGRIEVANTDPADLQDLSRARLAISGLGVSLEHAAREYAEAHKLLEGRSVSGFVQTHLARVGKLKDATMMEAAHALIEEKTARGKGHTWIKSLRNFLLNSSLKKLEKPMIAVTVEDLENLLRTWSGRTRNNKIRFLVQLFNYAKGKYIPEAERSVAQKLPFDVETPGEVQIWTPEEAKLLLNQALPEELPFFAIAMFSGIRTCEICRMDWSQVRPHPDPDESHIEVKAAGSKKQLGRRIVPILPALAAFLEKTGVPKSGRIVPNSNMQTRQELLALRTGLDWKYNGCRHSFGSYRMADIKNVYQVAEEMGNSPAMVKKHYFQAVTKAEAARFWAIRPK